MASQFQLTTPVSAMLVNDEGEPVRVTLPIGAMLQPTSQPSTTLLGMLAIHWDGRHYSVSLPELLLKAERVEVLE
jgi:hypothetical protein